MDGSVPEAEGAAKIREATHGKIDPSSRSADFAAFHDH
jgi:hypothetical protein